MRAELQSALLTAEMFTKLLYPFAEVVIHDLEKDQIEAIFNPFSQREKGDRSYLERWDFTHDPKASLIGPYEKMNFDGRKLKSISLVLRDAEGLAVGFLCVNMDISIFETYRDKLVSFLGNNEKEMSDSTKSLFKDDLYEQINLFVQKFCTREHLSLETLQRKHKQKLIFLLQKEGALEGKNATSYIARVLKISRATVYNYLKESQNYNDNE